MNVLGPPELGHSPPLHLAQLTMEVSKSLWVVIYGRKILCFIGIFLAHNEHHSFVHFCWKWGLPCEALCIGVFFISNFCFVHVQWSMNSRTCYNKVWTCFVFSSILTSTSIAKETTVVYTTAVEPNIPKVGTSKPKINQKVLYSLLNSHLFWQLIPPKRTTACVMDVMDVSHPPLRPRGWTHGTLCVSRDCLGVSLELLRWSNEFTSPKFSPRRWQFKYVFFHPYFGMVGMVGRWNFLWFFLYTMDDWVVVSNTFFSPRKLGKIFQFDSYFFDGWEEATNQLATRPWKMLVEKDDPASNIGALNGRPIFRGLAELFAKKALGCSQEPTSKRIFFKATQHGR